MWNSIHDFRCFYYSNRVVVILNRERFQATSVENGGWIGEKWSSECSCHVDGEVASHFFAHHTSSFRFYSHFSIKRSALNSVQEVPSTCQDTFNYTVTQSHYEEHGKYMETLCSDAVCNVPQDAHRINVRIFRHGSLFVEDSVYVPATGESEFWCFWLCFWLPHFINHNA